MNQQPQQPQTPGEIQIEIDDLIAQGIYCNLAMIGHSETEFILDFIFVQPQPQAAPKGRVRSRIITSPQHIKRLLYALQDNLKKYEEKFGEIKPPAPTTGKQVGFYH